MVSGKTNELGAGTGTPFTLSSPVDEEPVADEQRRFHAAARYAKGLSEQLARADDDRNDGQDADDEGTLALTAWPSLTLRRTMSEGPRVASSCRYCNPSGDASNPDRRSVARR